MDDKTLEEFRRARQNVSKSACTALPEGIYHYRRRGAFEDFYQNKQILSGLELNPDGGYRAHSFKNRIHRTY